MVSPNKPEIEKQENHSGMKILSRLFTVLFALLVFILFLPSCYYDSEEMLYPTLSGDCDTGNVSFSGSVLPMLQNYCWSCHSNAVAAKLGNSIFLEDYQDIVQSKDAVLGAIKHEAAYSAMPKGAPKLSPCLISSFEIWVNNGAAQD